MCQILRHCENGAYVYCLTSGHLNSNLIFVTFESVEIVIKSALSAPADVVDLWAADIERLSYF